MSGKRRMCSPEFRQRYLHTDLIQSAVAMAVAMRGELAVGDWIERVRNDAHATRRWL